MAETPALELNSTINAVCAHLRNFFVLPTQKMARRFELTNGTILLPLELKIGQRVWIEPTGEHTEAYGSYRIKTKLSADIGEFLYGLDGLEGISDTWQGTIYGQRIPPDFISLCESIATWEAANQPSNLISESISGFYKKTLATGENGLPADAYEVFAKGLARFPKRMFTGVRYS